MKFFLDTANIDEIKELVELGLVDGVTTNPSLVAKTGRSYRQVIEEVCELCDGPISAEVLANDFEGMLAEAREWHKVGKQVVVKVPLTSEGLKVVRACFKEGIKTNVTLCFSVIQAIAAAKAGASFISPFVGRLDDIGQDGMDLIHEIEEVYDHYDFDTEILVASVRSLDHVKEAALCGAHVATIPTKIFRQLLDHPLTKKGLEKFEEDSKRIPKAS